MLSQLNLVCYSCARTTRGVLTGQAVSTDEKKSLGCHPFQDCVTSCHEFLLTKDGRRYEIFWIGWNAPFLIPGTDIYLLIMIFMCLLSLFTSGKMRLGDEWTIISQTVDMFVCYDMLLIHTYQRFRNWSRKIVRDKKGSCSLSVCLFVHIYFVSGTSLECYIASDSEHLWGM